MKRILVFLMLLAGMLFAQKPGWDSGNFYIRNYTAADKSLVLLSQDATISAYYTLETADADAIGVALALPDDSGNYIPILYVGDQGILDKNWGLVTGMGQDAITEPIVFVADADEDSYVKIGHSGDDAGILMSYSELTISTQKAGEDIILDPAGNNVLPGSDNADIFGQADTRWTEIYSDEFYVGDSTTTDHDGIIYFADDASKIAESIMWNDGNDRFEFSDDMYTAGSFEVDNIQADSIYVDTLEIGSIILSDADGGADIGKSGLAFGDGWIDSVFAISYAGQSDFSIGIIGQNATIKADSIKNDGTTVLFGIDYDDLLDKSAEETVSEKWTFSDTLVPTTVLTPYKNTVIVAKEGGDYATVQAAITYAATQSPSATSKWTVLIYPGVYDEVITMSKHVNLMGIGSKNSIVITHTTTVITFADSVEVQNLTVRAGDAGEIYCFQDNGVACYAKVMDVHFESLYDGGSGWYGFWATAAGDYTFERCSYRITTSIGDAGGFMANAVAATVRVIDGDFYMAGATGPPTSSKSHLACIATSNCTFISKGNRFDGDANCNTFYAEDGTFTSSNDAILTKLADQIAGAATVYIKNGFREYTVDDDDILNFSNREDTGSETFGWDEGDNRFELSDDLYTPDDMIGDTAFFDVYTNNSDFVLGAAGEDITINADSLKGDLQCFA